MFTGIIEEVGTVKAVTRRGDGAEITVDCGKVISDVHTGDSIAVNGTCLTVVRFDGASFTAEAVKETLERTTTGTLAPGAPVNLERAMPVNGRLGGHIVQGHVDCTGIIRTIVKERIGHLVQVEVPAKHLRYVVEKGSVTLDGISLTVAKLGSDTFTVAVIPHTFAVTTLGKRKPGDRLNIECDILGKYIERLMRPEDGRVSGLTAEYMKRMGF